VARHTFIHVTIATLICWWGFAFRFAQPDFRNDHFDHLSKARQVLAGELPERDFYDDGRPLTIYVSAALQRLSPTLLPELILGAGALAGGAVFVYLLARALSGSTLLGACAAFLTMAMRPRFYNYPKVLLFPLALCLLFRYFDRPTKGRLAQLAIMTGVAFLFRHDYGVYVAFASVCGVVAFHRGREALMPLALYVSIGLASVAPYLVWLVSQGRLVPAGSEVLTSVGTRMPGIVRTAVHLNLSHGFFEIAPMTATIGIRWAQDVTPDRRQLLEHQYGLEPVESKPDGRSFRYSLGYPSQAQLRRLLNDPAVEDTGGIDRHRVEVLDTRWRHWQAAVPLLRVKAANIFPSAADAQGWIYYVFLLSVPITLLILWRSSVRSVEHETVKVLSLAILCAVLHQLLILSERGVDLEARLPDVVAPTAVLVAWIVRRVAQLVRRDMKTAAWVARAVIVTTLITVAMITWWGVAMYAETTFRRVVTAGFTHPSALAAVARVIHRPPIDYWTGGKNTGTAALARYVARCLSPEDRLLAIAYIPEVFYLSNRLFAGGTNSFVPNGFSLRDEQVLARLKDQSVPVVVIDENYRQFFEAGWPSLGRYVASRYRDGGLTGFGDSEYHFRILTDTERQPTRMDIEWGLPCFSRS